MNRDILMMLVDPPEVPWRSTHPHHPLAGGKVGWPGDGTEPPIRAALSHVSWVFAT
jgi:hypothetical protein